MGSFVLCNLLCAKLFLLAAAEYKDSKTLSLVYFRLRKSVFVSNELTGDGGVRKEEKSESFH